MRALKKIISLTLVVFSLCLQSCIHEYPVFTPGKGPEKGEDPTKIDTFVEVVFNLSWESIIHKVEFSSRARDEKPHRFIFELYKNGMLDSRDMVYLSDSEFSKGHYKHRLSTPLERESYELAVWYDMQDSEGDYVFDANSLRNVSINNFSTVIDDNMQCAYAASSFDFRDVDPTKETTVTKELEMSYPGARFEIVATDVQEFILMQKEALNQGDYFSVNLSISNGGFSCFNLFTDNPHNAEENLEFSGRMRLPFAEYDELKIAEGFVFCYPSDEVYMKLSVTNSAFSTVSRTDYFSFPVKRGCITTIAGDFLTHPIDGVFSIDHIWEGEIVIEI